MNDRTRFLLDIYTDYLLVSFGQATATGLATLLPKVVSHDQVTRFLANHQFESADLWKMVKPHIRKIQADDACLIFDDTIEEKPHTDPNEIIAWHFDHCQNRNVKGINLLTALYHSDGMSLPVDFTLVHKTEWVKNPKTGKEHWTSKGYCNFACSLISCEVGRDSLVSAEQDVEQSAKQPVYVSGKRGTLANQITDAMPKKRVASFGNVGLTTTFLAGMVLPRSNQVWINHITIRIHRLARVVRGNPCQHQRPRLLVASTDSKGQQ